MHGRLLAVMIHSDGVDLLRRAMERIAAVVVERSIDKAIGLLATEDNWIGLVIGESVRDAKAAAALATFRRRFPDAPALLLTTAPHATVMHRAFRTNTGYVCVPLKPDVARTFATRVMLHVRIAFPALERRADGLATSYALTTNETHIVGLILRGYGREQLAGVMGVTENTLKTRIRRLLRKFGVRSLRALLASILRSGQEPEAALTVLANDAATPPSSAERVVGVK
jgi:DNA-binding NarL/FixJ family response regulator